MDAEEGLMLAGGARWGMLRSGALGQAAGAGQRMAERLPCPLSRSQGCWWSPAGRTELGVG